MSGYTLGILSSFGVSNIVQTILVLVLLEYVLISILAIFENRFHTVCTFSWKHYWSTVRPFWLAAHYLISIVILIPFGFLTPNQEIAKKLVIESLPCIPDYLLQSDLFVLSDDYTYHMIAMVTFLVTALHYRMVSCSPVTTSYFASPDFLLHALHGATIISIPIHFFGFYCILFKTPDQMKSVKWYFLNLHVWIVCYDYSVCFLTIPMLLLPTMAGYNLGFLKDVGVPDLLQVVLVFLFLEYLLLSILAIFENRFYTVCTFGWKNYWSAIRGAWLGIHYLVGLVILIPFWFLAPDQDLARKKTFEKLPCLPSYIYEAPRIFVTADNYTYHITVLTTFLIIGVLEALVFIIFLVFNTITQLKSKKMSQKLFEIQKKFFMALVIQMFVPMIFMIIPLSYAVFSILNNYYNQALTNIGVVMESSHGLVSSLVMIFIHRPYREAFFNLFSKEPKVLMNISLIPNNSLLNNRVAPLNKI
ncbi:unnamed protein product [Caenorhabditis brenneri]